MKHALLGFFLLVTLNTQAQRSRVYVPERNSEERTEQMEAIHKLYDPKFPKQAVVFSPVSDSYRSDGNWAFLHVMIFQKNGKPVDFTHSEYKELWNQGAMDSNGIMLLFKKERGHWRIVQAADFPTDVPYGCWWRQYGADKELFPYTEPEGNCPVAAKEKRRGN